MQSSRSRLRSSRRALVFLCLFAASAFGQAVKTDANSPVAFPGPAPLIARATSDGVTFTLTNNVLSVSWKFADGHVRPSTLVDALHAVTLDQSACELFRLSTKALPPPTTKPAAPTYPELDLPASAFHFTTPQAHAIVSNEKGTRLAEHVGGQAIDADGISDGGVHAHWHAELRDGSHYLRQTLSLTAPGKDLPLSGVGLTDIAVHDAQTVGHCPGSPVVAGGFFAGVEMPGAVNDVDVHGARIGFGCRLTLGDEPYTFGSVLGVAPDGQMRRSFLAYIERERARPSRPFLHYNSWYDLGLDKLNAQNLTDTITAIHHELVVARSTPIASYMIDDGWDDYTHGLWAENQKKFPGGFAALAPQLKAIDAHLGLWISPMGGYSGANERVATARQMGLIPPDSGLDLSQPKYKAWFLARCRQLMHDAGMNIFKWDKAGDGVSPHFMSLLDVANQLHADDPRLFINVTVGTWPSPFWLNFIDSTWRTGTADISWTGKGADPANKFDRERWLTFRDGACYKQFVRKAPLYPLNSVMHHGIAIGRYYQGGSMPTAGPSFTHDVRAYFANGTSLQELYITPSLLDAKAWDDLATSAKWAAANADVLIDSHWVGGDPNKLQPYGYAAWCPRKGTLMLRNPSDHPATIDIEPGQVLELPAGAATHFTVASAYADTPSPVADMSAGHVTTISLKPFEVLVMELLPKN